MKKLLIVIFLAAVVLAAPAFAQVGPPPPGPGPQGGAQAGTPPDTVLKDVLGLTDTQLTTLKTLADTRRQAAEAIVPQLADAQKALADALQAASPDPAQLGVLLLNVKGLHTQLDQINQTFRTAFTNLLNGSQQQQVGQILSLEKQLQAAQVLHQLGL